MSPTSTPPELGALRLCVIVPALDEEQRLGLLCEELLRGADARDRPDELLVVDGGSRDASRAVAAARGARVLEAPRGRGHQLAAGARATKCELLWFLHADAWPLAGTLGALRDAFASEPRLCAAGCLQSIAAEGWFYRRVEGWADARVRRGIVFGDSALCVRRESYLAAGGFAPVPILEDVDLAQRLARLAKERNERIDLVAGARVAISARRWQREGCLAATLRNRALLVLYSLGVPPAALARWYPREPLRGGTAPQSEGGTQA